MLEFEIDPEDPQLLRIAIAYDFFFENYGLFLDAAVAAGKNEIELVDEMEEVLELSFGMADMFMSKAFTQEEEPDDNV
jgi:hypothetical protein